jgi:hypothetical protein
VIELPKDWDWKRPDYGPIFRERVERLKRIRDPKYDLAALELFYKDNPVDFIVDWGCTFDPRLIEIGLPATVPFILFPKQADYIRWLVDRWRNRQDGVTEKSRDAGASWLCIAFAVWMIRFHPGATVGFGSRKEEYVDNGEGDPKSLFWKARKFIELLPIELRPKVRCTHMQITNTENGASIVGEAGDNIGRGNRTSIYFVDEFAFVEHDNAVETALSQTSNCKQFVSTPNGVGNQFHKKRHSGKLQVFTMRWQDDPRKDKAWYEDQKSRLDDPVKVAQELDIDYNASSANAYITGRYVREACQRGPFDVQAIGPIMVGVDCARFGDDKTVITFRQGRVLFKMVAFGKADTVDVAGRVADMCLELAERPAQIAVDVIGIGAGVVDQLRRHEKLGKLVVEVNSSLRLDDGENYNLRARMWRDMRSWLKGVVSIPNDPELEVDLTVLRYGYRDNLLLIESKELAKKRQVRSPDRADSLALTFAFPPVAREEQLVGESFGVADMIAGY